MMMNLLWLLHMRFGTADVLPSGGEEAVSSKHKPRYNQFQHFSELPWSLNLVNTVFFLLVQSVFRVWSSFTECTVSRSAGISGLQSSPSPNSILEALTIHTYAHSNLQSSNGFIFSGLSRRVAPPWHLRKEKRKEENKFLGYLEWTCHQLATKWWLIACHYVWYYYSTIWSFMEIIWWRSTVPVCWRKGKIFLNKQRLPGSRVVNLYNHRAISFT